MKKSVAADLKNVDAQVINWAKGFDEADRAAGVAVLYLPSGAREKPYKMERWSRPLRKGDEVIMAVDHGVITQLTSDTPDNRSALLEVLKRLVTAAYAGCVVVGSDARARAFIGLLEAAEAGRPTQRLVEELFNSSKPKAEYHF